MCRKYIANMVHMFGDCSLKGVQQLEKAATSGAPVEMENFFSRLTLDIIGRAVFNYNFDSLTHDDPVIQASSVAPFSVFGCDVLSISVFFVNLLGFFFFFPL